MLNTMRDFDFYRKIPKDLTETSSHGAALSICASVFMLVLFIAELWAFLSMSISTSVVVDMNTDPLVRINFNISVFGIPCDYLAIDVVDILGTRNDNVTKNVNKWNLDSEGVRRNYDGRNTKQREIAHDSHHDLMTLTGNSVHAVDVSESGFAQYLLDHEYAFVDFYAPWCIWCQRLEPVWEALAREVYKHDVLIAVSISKVDCVANRQLCNEQKVQAFPTMRFFKQGKADFQDYHNDRTVEAFVQYLNEKMSVEAHLKTLTESDREQQLEKIKDDHDTSHPGCLMAGFLLVNRVPGNFHIEARSNYHNLNPAMANLSHQVHSLSFGPVMNQKTKSMISMIPSDLFSASSMSPMDGKVYANTDLHTAYHHYLKVVSTHFGEGFGYGSSSLLAYQIVESAQVMSYEMMDVPEARFAYDLSPMAAVINRKGKRWYEFVTSVCALIGGTFTVVGLISSFLGVVFKGGKRA